MGMCQTGDDLCFGNELVHGVGGELRMQHFDGGLCVEIDMFPKVDVGEATSSNHTDEAVVAKLLAHAIGHLCTPFAKCVTPTRFLYKVIVEAWMWICQVSE